MLPEKYKKNMKKLFILHASMTTRMMVTSIQVTHAYL